MLKRVISFAIMAAMSLPIALLTVSCGDEKNDPKWEWEGEGDDDDDDDKPVVGGKPRFIWVDAAANFPDFANSKSNIARDLALAKDAGFTDIVVDVRPTSGDVLFSSTVVDPVKRLGAWLPGGFQWVNRTETWDYLQAFIDEARKQELRIHAAINTFTGGNSSSIGNEGVVFRDQTKSTWTTDLNLVGGVTSIMKTSQSAKFFNPVRPEVQDYLCNILKDLAKYDLDGIFLDRGRFDGFTSDFSNYTRAEFEKYIKNTVANFPADILPAGTTTLPNPAPVWMKQWIEFRAKVIHDFMVKARAAVKGVNSKIKFGVYVGGWYSSYYDVGVNWGSTRFSASTRFPSWASQKYQDYGYADHMDQMLIGAYAGPMSVYGTTEWTMQGFCLKAKEYTMGDCPLVAGGPDVGNWDAQDNVSQDDENKAIVKSVKACMDACDGYFLFDMIHLKKAGQWQYAKKGISEALAK